jgi:hypothetical protein
MDTNDRPAGRKTLKYKISSRLQGAAARVARANRSVGNSKNSGRSGGEGANRAPQNLIFEENKGSYTSILPTYNNII